LYPRADYNKHESARIPMAAVHINKSSVRVQFTVVRVISARVLF